MFGLWVASIILFFILVRLASTMLPMADESRYFPLPFGSIDTLAGIVTIYVTTVGGFLLTCALTAFLHEAIHALMYWVYGYRPQISKRKVMCADPNRVTRNQQVLVSLMPLLILSLVIAPLLLVPWLRFFALVALVGNATGSLDDLWIAYRASKAVNRLQAG